MTTFLPHNDRKELSILALRFFIHLFALQNHKLAAEQLHLSASKGSRLLNELREHFEDELFVRFGSRMFPTKRAEQLQPEIESLLAKFDGLTTPTTFAPSSLERTFRIEATDNAVASFIAHIMPAFYQSCPKGSLEVLPVRKSLAHDLKTGFCDLAIYPWRNDFATLKHQILFEKRFVVLVEKGHPLQERLAKHGHLILSDLLDFRQVKISVELPSAHGNTVDIKAIGVQNRERSAAAVTTPYFLSVPLFLQSAPLYAIVTEQLAQFFMTTHPQLIALPMPESKAERAQPTMLLWSETQQNDPGVQWLRSLFLCHSQEGIH